jgi:hydrogenase maturation protein HypF
LIATMSNGSSTAHASLAEAATERLRLHLSVRGAVQGVGFRPYVYRLANELGLGGWVANDTRGVEIEVEGSAQAVAAFRDRLPAEVPPLAAIHRLESARVEGDGAPPLHGFEIRASRADGARTAVVLPDAATCPECLAEVLDPAARRRGYAFTNCTHCGPRFTIVRALPYDRPNTTMAGFALCPECRGEYEEPADRRFHAQPVACPACGPRLALWDAEGLPLPGDPLAGAAAALRRGEVVAVKGLGGFQLLADARSSAAVARLRRRKHREEKPFAVMVADLGEARALCEIPPAAESELASARAPIVLLERLPERQALEPVAPEVAPGNPSLGLMLPTTPLHHLLLRELACPVVATSGNRSDEPIAIDEREAVERLRGVADRFLVHDRPIARHADDSVVRVLAGEVRVLRRARGYAPMPIHLPRPAAPILALGAQLKNTVALAVGEQVYLSQHLGDMETPETLAAFERVVADFLRLYDASPVAIAHDLHPDYASTRYARVIARRLAEERGEPIPTIAVQHHHAHLAACLLDADPESADRPALGVTWDGTGHGTDGTVWGGELLLGDAASYRRVGHLLPFRLPGGDAAVREPRRVALALLWELLGPGAFKRRDLVPVAGFAPAELRLLSGMLEGGVNSPVTTSAGRLFDGVAALLGLAQRAAFEGQAAMALEHLAARESGRPAAWGYPVALDGSPAEGLVLDWRPLLLELLRDLGRGTAAERVAGRFHRGLAAAVVAAAEAVGEPRVALTGGCFQNRLLTEELARRLAAAGFQVLLHRRVPPNDGGVSLGQVAVAAARLEGALDRTEETERSRKEPPCA